MFYSGLWACRKRAGGVAVKTWIYLIFGNFERLAARGTNISEISVPAYPGVEWWLVMARTHIT